MSEKAFYMYMYDKYITIAKRVVWDKMIVVYRSAR